LSKIEHICKIKSNEVVKDINTSFEEFKEMIHKKLELIVEEENKFPFELKVNIDFSLPKVNLNYSELLDGKISNPFIFMEHCDFKFYEDKYSLMLEIFFSLEFNFCFEFSQSSYIYSNWYIISNKYKDRLFIIYIYKSFCSCMRCCDRWYRFREIGSCVSAYENNLNVLEPTLWTTYDDGKFYSYEGFSSYSNLEKKYFMRTVIDKNKDEYKKKSNLSCDTYYDWLNSVATSLDIKIDYSNIDKNHSDLIKRCNNLIKCNIIKAIFYIRQNYIYRGDMKGTWNKRISSISSNDVDIFCQYIINCNSITSLDDLFIGKILNVFKNNELSDTKFRLFQELDKEIEIILHRLPNVHLRFILMVYCCIIGIGNIGNVFDYFSDSDGNDDTFDGDFFKDLNFLNWSKVKEFIDRNHK